MSHWSEWTLSPGRLPWKLELIAAKKGSELSSRSNGSHRWDFFLLCKIGVFTYSVLVCYFHLLKKKRNLFCTPRRNTTASLIFSREIVFLQKSTIYLNIGKISGTLSTKRYILYRLTGFRAKVTFEG